MFILGDGVVFLRESYTLVWRNSYVSCIIWSSLCFWSSMYKFLSPLIVLEPQDLNLNLYAQVCWLCCVLYMPLFGLVQARPWFRSSMWISSVAGISKILCTSEVATERIELVRTQVRMLDILLLGINLSWCVPLWRIENPWFLLAKTASQTCA